MADVTEDHAEPNGGEQETRAVLFLENGTLLEGRSFGFPGEEIGEVCFNTSMTGYQEIVTDPSYAGQIVTMTSPQIGNVGVNATDMESSRPWIKGLVVREYSRIASNWRSTGSLGDFLHRHRIPAISGVDTRRLVGILRDQGAQRGILSTQDFDPDSLRTKTLAWPGLAGCNLTGVVTCKAPFAWHEPLWRHPSDPQVTPRTGPDLPVVVLDGGVKRNILRHLVSAGCTVLVMPIETPAEAILERHPRGILLSNGPGDPAAVVQAIATIRKLVNANIPLFGICLGHQMLCLALGGRTGKLKFGHRGGNHPVQQLDTGRVEVTSQNHGFVVLDEELPDALTVTHRSLFDGSIEGVGHRSLPVFSVQFHPEASPGPRDAHPLFHRFVEQMSR